MSKKSKIILSVILMTASIPLSIIYYKAQKHGEIIVAKASQYLSKKTGRKVNIGSVSYSVVDGLVIKDALIKEKDGKTDFLSFKRAEIKINEKKFIDGELVFEKVAFYGGKLRIENTQGKWNFEDLLNLLPPSQKPIQLVWNAKEFSFEDFFVSFFLNNMEISLDKCDLSILHRSSTGGNFFFSLSTKLSGIKEKKFFSADLQSEGDLVYDYALLKSAKIDTDMENILYDQVSVKSLSFSGHFLDMDKKLFSNFNSELEIKNLFVPSLKKNFPSFSLNIEMAEKALGKNILSEKDFSIENLSIYAKSKKSESEINFSVKSNLIDIQFFSLASLDKGDNIKAVLEISDSKMKLNALSDFNKVKFQENLSETLGKSLEKLILEFEKMIVIKIVR